MPQSFLSVDDNLEVRFCWDEVFPGARFGDE